jgi:hypothetical protein
MGKRAVPLVVATVALVAALLAGGWSAAWAAGAAPVTRGNGTGPITGAEVTSRVTVERPVGHIVVDELDVVADGSLVVRVTDTRADDPGWTVTAATPVGPCTAQALTTTPGFVDGSGRTYAQQVDGGHARAGRGLGVATLQVHCPSGGPITLTAI